MSMTIDDCDIRESNLAGAAPMAPQQDLLVGDGSKAKATLGWEPATRLRQGLEPTYRWIAAQLAGNSQFQSAGSIRAGET